MKFKFAFALMAALIALPIHAQSYRPVAIPLPFTYLAAATSTNLANGWTNTTYTTNITTLYSSSTGTFLSTTNIATNNVLTYADFSLLSQRFAGIQLEFNMSASTTTNIDVTFSCSVDGVHFDNTANCRTISFAAAGTTKEIYTTNLDLSGFGYGRITTFYNRDASAVLTNNNFVYGAYSGLRN